MRTNLFKNVFLILLIIAIALGAPLSVLGQMPPDPQTIEESLKQLGEKGRTTSRWKIAACEVGRTVKGTGKVCVRMGKGVWQISKGLLKVLGILAYVFDAIDIAYYDPEEKQWITMRESREKGIEKAIPDVIQDIFGVQGDAMLGGTKAPTQEEVLVFVMELIEKNPKEYFKLRERMLGFLETPPENTEARYKASPEYAFYLLLKNMEDPDPKSGYRTVLDRFLDLGPSVLDDLAEEELKKFVKDRQDDLLILQRLAEKYNNEFLNNLLTKVKEGELPVAVLQRLNNKVCPGALTRYSQRLETQLKLLEELLGSISRFLRDVAKEITRLNQELPKIRDSHQQALVRVKIKKLQTVGRNLLKMAVTIMYESKSRFKGIFGIVKGKWFAADKLEINVLF